MKTIKDFLWDNRIKVKEFAEIIGLSETFVYTIQDKTALEMNMKAVNILNIYQKTEEHFGEGKGLKLFKYSKREVADIVEEKLDKKLDKK